MVRIPSQDSFQCRVLVSEAGCSVVAQKWAFTEDMLNCFRSLLITVAVVGGASLHQISVCQSRMTYSEPAEHHLEGSSPWVVHLPVSCVVFDLP